MGSYRSHLSPFQLCIFLIMFCHLDSCPDMPWSLKWCNFHEMAVMVFCRNWLPGFQELNLNHAVRYSLTLLRYLRRGRDHHLVSSISIAMCNDELFQLSVYDEMINYFSSRYMRNNPGERDTKGVFCKLQCVQSSLLVFNCQATTIHKMLDRFACYLIMT